MFKISDLALNNNFGNKRKLTITLTDLTYFTLLLYFCALNANRTGDTFDGLFLRGTFILYLLVWTMNILVSRFEVKMNLLILWVLLFVGYCYLSFAWAKNISDSGFYNPVFIRILCITPTLPSLVKTQKDIDRVLRLFLISTVYTSVLLLIKTPFSLLGTERVGEAIGVHSNGLGLKLAAGTLICVYFIFKNKKGRFLYAFCAIGFTVLTLLTGSRKSIIMIIICVLAFVIFFKYKNTDTKAFFSKVVLVLFFVGCLLLLYYVMMNVEFFYNIIGYRLESMFTGAESDTSIAERAFFEKKAVELFSRYPAFGYGLNNFTTHMREIGYSHIAYSHNNYLELLSTLGIVGFCIYYVPLIILTFNIFRCLIKNREDCFGLFVLVYIGFLFAVGRYMIYFTGESNYIYFLLGYIYLQNHKGEKKNVPKLN